MPESTDRAASELPALRIANLSKRFVAGGKVVEALRQVDLTIWSGQFICLLGASGCGKSTLLRMAAGFESIEQGTIESFGTPVTDAGPERGVVFQDYALFPWLTVIENIAFGPLHQRSGKLEATRVAEKYIDLVGLGKYANHYPSQLSGGMKQRVAIARVLANDCDILLMDEPFGALDALTREKLQLDLLQIWQNSKLSIVFVTHSVEEAILLADRVVVMSASPGKIDFDTRIEIPRPRKVASEQFNAIREALSARLTSHVHAAV